MKFPRLGSVITTVILIAPCSIAQDSGDSLRSGFEQPPDSAKPRVWWHWMNGNITKQGIKLDLEWMKRVGIGGFQNFDAALATPQIVDKRLVYMTPEWKDAFRYAATLADELGLEMAIAGSPGWSESGGPWVPPSHAMKKFVWSETVVEGGKPFTGALAKPPSTTGPFQNIPRTGGVAALMGEKLPPFPQYYADAAVVAYRLPDDDKSMSSFAAEDHVERREFRCCGAQRWRSAECFAAASCACWREGLDSIRVRAAADDSRLYTGGPERSAKSVRASGRKRAGTRGER